jgi:hypothetical protein
MPKSVEIEPPEARSGGSACGRARDRGCARTWPGMLASVELQGW